MKTKNRRNVDRSVRFLFLTAVCLGLVFIVLAQFAAPASADDRSFHFPQVLIDAEIHPDGSMTVVENRTFSFNGRFRGAFQHIYLKHNASIRDVLVSEQGEAYRQEAPGTRDIPGIFYIEQYPDRIYIDWSFEALNEQRTFTVSYTVDNAVLAHQDVAELYYQFIGNESDVRTDFARVVLTLPEGSTAEELRVWGHGPLYGNVWKDGANVVVWEINDLPKRTFLEGRVVFPLQLVPGADNMSGREGLAGILAEEGKWAGQANRRRLLAKVDLYAGIPVFLGALVFYLVLRRKAFTDPQAYQGDYYRELPGDYSPAEAGHFYRLGRTVTDDITATLMDLTRRGHLILEEFQGEKGLLIKRSFTDYRIYPAKGRGRLVGHESKLYRFLFETVAQQAGGSVTFKEIERFSKKQRQSTAVFYQGWSSNVKQRVQNLGFFGSAAWAGVITGGVLLVVGFISLVKEFMPIAGVAFLVTGALLAIMSGSLKNLTPEGADHLAKWRAFRRFLLHFSEMDRSTIPALVIWEHYLVYAISLGVAKEVIKQLSIVYPQLREQPHLVAPWFAMTMTNPASFDSLAASMKQSFRTATSSSSSGSGGGGGFSGGGGGGGGGGGVGAR